MLWTPYTVTAAILLAIIVLAFLIGDRIMSAISKDLEKKGWQDDPKVLFPWDAKGKASRQLEAYKTFYPNGPLRLLLGLCRGVMTLSFLAIAWIMISLKYQN